jgi:hypothetical protein
MQTDTDRLSLKGFCNTTAMFSCGSNTINKNGTTRHGKELQKPRLRRQFVENPSSSALYSD